MTGAAFISSGAAGCAPSPQRRLPLRCCAISPSASAARVLTRRRLLSALGATAAASLLPLASPPRRPRRSPPAAAAEPPAVERTGSGLQYIEVTTGSGPRPAPGQLAKVHYTLTLGGFDGRVVDSSRTRKRPFRFNVGAGQVIAGWDEAIATMNVGGRRKLIIPPELGYGSRGAGGAIPPNATLYFDVELLGLDQ